MMRNIRTWWPFRHLGLKLLSVALAVLLWMVIAGEETVERGLRIPLELQQFPPGLELDTEPPSLVDARVRGAAGTLSRISSGDVVAVIDLRGAKVGRRMFPLTPDQVRVPFGVEIVQVTPPTVTLLLENSASKLVPVEPTLEGKPAAGFVVASTIVDPASVEIVGPDSAVKQATEAVTEPVSLNGTRVRVRETVKVGMVDSALHLKTSRSVVVEVEIVPAPVERTVLDVPVHLKNLATNLTAQLNPSTVNVNVRGSRDGLSRPQGDDVSVYVDLAGLGAGPHTLPVRAGAAREAGVTRIEPAVVQVRIANGKD